MNIFSLGQSLANTFERNARHSRLKKLQPIFQNWEAIERNLSPEEKALKRTFFRNTVFSGAILFLFFTAVPYLQRFDESFWPLFPAEASFMVSENFSMADEGYLAKSSIPTTKGDRRDMNEAFSYTVKSGDTLSSIAYKFDLRVRTLLDNNTIDSPNRLKTGTVLTILPVDGLLYKVEGGDTLESLAKKYNIKVEDIQRQNSLSGNTLIAGGSIVLPGAKSLRPDPTPIPLDTIARGNTKPNGGNKLKIPPPSASSPSSAGKKLVFPTNGNITQYYHYGHYAIDIANRSRPNTVAAASGTVVKASYGWNSGYGNVVIIDHGGGLQTLYGHHDTLYVKEGDYVNAGQAIGKMGNSGKVYGSTGIHLHFEVRVNGAKKNPMEYF